MLHYIKKNKQKKWTCSSLWGVLSPLRLQVTLSWGDAAGGVTVELSLRIAELSRLEKTLKVIKDPGAEHKTPWLSDVTMCA